MLRDIMTNAQNDHLHSVLRDIAEERGRQHQKWGEQNHPGFPDDSDADDMREMADAAREMCEKAFADGNGTYSHILAEEFCEAYAEVNDEAKLREELIQVAAVAVAWVEAIDRRKNHG